MSSRGRRQCSGWLRTQKGRKGRTSTGEEAVQRAERRDAACRVDAEHAEHEHGAGEGGEDEHVRHSNPFGEEAGSDTPDEGYAV